MKAYCIGVIIIAVLSTLAAIYFYLQLCEARQNSLIYKEESGQLALEKISLQNQLDLLQEEKKKLVADLALSSLQLENVRSAVVLLNKILNSFMYAGDIRALTVGLKEAEAVEAAIGNLNDSQTRMAAERDWAEFKKSRYFNPLFGLLRNLSRGIEQNVLAPADSNNAARQPLIGD
jgi:hypothetical protein